MLAHLRESWSSEHLRRNAWLSFGLLLPVLFILPRFLDFVEHRPGVTLPDPLLGLLPTSDLTWLIFGCIYGAIVVAVTILLRRPESFLLAARTYALMAIVRMMAMWLVPLDPPPGMIALKDPFVEFFGSGVTLTRDLFFSGHTSTLVMFALVMPSRGWKTLFALLAAIVGTSVLIQHVHYSIDVLAAPFFAFGAFALARVIGFAGGRN
jgi:hypothetical protein